MKPNQSDLFDSAIENEEFMSFARDLKESTGILDKVQQIYLKLLGNDKKKSFNQQCEIQKIIRIFTNK